MIQHGLLCVQSFAIQCPKQMYTNWAKFLPSGTSRDVSLASIIQTHPSERVRIAACGVLVSFFKDSKKYLAMAGGGDVRASFTTLSEKIGNQISCTIQAILNSLHGEIRPNVIDALLEVLHIMLQNCPFQQLNVNYLPPIYSTLIQEFSKDGMF